jgi:opacity protein-like surface antigen
MKRIIAAALLAAALTGTAAHATGSQQEAKWSNYRDRKTGNEVVIKAVCLDAEDSAAHLKLKAFRDHGGHVVFGCYKHGY